MPSPREIAEALRDYGCVVVEDPGWHTRGTHYSFDPYAQAVHHDAFSENVSDKVALRAMREGRVDLAGPLCNGWIDSDSKVWLIAAGNANHAGWNEIDVHDRLKRGLEPLGDARTDPDKDGIVGNKYLWGWECRNAGTGTDPWEQLHAMESACAAIADVFGWSPVAIAAHRELTARKIDPAGIDMHQFRLDVRKIYGLHQDEGVEMDQIVWFKNASGEYAYLVTGRVGKALSNESYALAKYLQIPEVNKRATAFDAAWQGTVCLFDGACQNIK